MRNLLLPVSLCLVFFLFSCSPKTPPPKSKTTGIDHPAPDQAKIDSLKEIRGKDKK